MEKLHGFYSGLKLKMIWDKGAYGIISWETKKTCVQVEGEGRRRGGSIKELAAWNLCTFLQSPRFFNTLIKFVD